MYERKVNDRQTKCMCVSGEHMSFHYIHFVIIVQNAFRYLIERPMTADLMMQNMLDYNIQIDNQKGPVRWAFIDDSISGKLTKYKVIVRNYGNVKYGLCTSRCSLLCLMSLWCAIIHKTIHCSIKIVGLGRVIKLRVHYRTMSTQNNMY